MSSDSPYDFIVVGGGTAGLVVASRLSDDPTHTVLVLEAGPAADTEDPRIKTPALFETLKGSELDWDFKTTPQATLNDRVIHVNQGKCLGGSSAINAFVFVPPVRSSVDAWELLGNKGWNWDGLQPYLTRAYSSPPEVDEKARVKLGIDKWTVSNHDARGPIETSFPADHDHPVRRQWAETFAAKDRLMSKDPFTGSSVGSFSCLASIHPTTKERVSSASSYLSLARDRPNLHVLSGCEVQKILLGTGRGHAKSDRLQSPSSIRASGVQYQTQGKVMVVNATREVILAAGPLRSPKLLELSGIGNAQLLKRLGIDVVLDLPGVGENLQDHVVSSVGYETVDEVDTLDGLIRQEPGTLAQAMQDYGTNRTGPLSHVGVTSYAYLPLPSDEGRDTVKKMLAENRPQPGAGTDTARELAYFEVTGDALVDPLQPSGSYLTVAGQTTPPGDPSRGSPAGPIQGKFLTIGAMLSQPLSRGTVHIQSRDASASPVIDPRYLSNPVDVEVLSQHMLNIETIAKSSPLCNLLKRPLRRRDPASYLTGTESAKAWLRASAASMWRLAGSCSMLPEEKGGVVDATLRVHGVSNLRVVDSSAIPLISTANLQATVYAFAERAADLIKETWSED